MMGNGPVLVANVLAPVQFNILLFGSTSCHMLASLRLLDFAVRCLSNQLSELVCRFQQERCESLRDSVKVVCCYAGKVSIKHKQLQSSVNMMHSGTMLSVGHLFF